MSPRIGVLALQGDIQEHLEMLARLSCDATPVKTAASIAECDGLIIPGGESTTIGKLTQRFEIEPAIQELHAAERPIFGTCAGLILLAREIVGSDQWRLGFLDVSVERNAYGRQVDSFEADIEVTGVEGGPVRAVFIRAPVIRAVHGDCESLAEFDGLPILVREGHLLGASFHPELTDDTRVHEYFVSMCS